VVVGGRSFHDREEILALRNVLSAIEWPDDEFRVYAALRGPLVALSDEKILAFRHQVGPLHPWHSFNEELAEELEEVAAALRLLAELHRLRNQRRLTATMIDLLQRLRAPAAVALWPSAEQALANMLQLLDLGRRFEEEGMTSFRAFVDYLTEAAERGGAPEAPLVEEGTDGVRMMTVHKAKGLEFAVVILADPTAGCATKPSRHVDPEQGLWCEPIVGCMPHDLVEHHDVELAREQQEEIRLVYVAATRARDVLVVPVLGDQLIKGWLEVLNPVVYPPLKTQRSPLPAPGCPRFGRDSVLERPAGAEATAEDAVAPGLHHPRQGAHQVVWWDPRQLTLGLQPEAGVHPQRVCHLLKSATAAQGGDEAYQRWLQDQERLRRHAALPSFQTATVTGLAHGAETALASPPLGDEPPLARRERFPVDIFYVSSDRGPRPGGKRFGTLVHAALATVDFSASAAQVQKTVQTHGRMLGAAAIEIEAAVQVILEAFAHPLLRRAAQSDCCRRECPVMIATDEGVLVEGIVDLAFREEAAPQGARWMVVDFKTDQHLDSSKISAYSEQLWLYLQAVERATGEVAEGCLLVL
jgi:ATP-dependent exoDNAse (exonuclease V) beta subunit